MATPTSSATSPSPPMPYLSHPPIADRSSPGSPIDTHEREIRKKAVQKFLARAEISMVTRALRARLSYASYKAAHNVSHVPLRELEAQLLHNSQAASFNRTIAAKRKSAGTSNAHFSNATIPSSSSAGAGASGATARRGAMAPPATIVSSPRSHHSTINGSANGAAGGRSSAASSSARGSASGQQSLYTTILAPVTPVARTVRNAGDPPVQPSSRPTASPRVRTVKASPKSPAAGGRTHSKAKQQQPDKKPAASPARRKGKRASAAAAATVTEKGKGKGKRQQRQQQQRNDVDVDGDVDMKAAATLTSLLLHHHHRGSIHGSASSPRSSIDGSETGSVYSYSHFAQSSARSTTAPAVSPPGSISSATTMTGAEVPYRQQQHRTPPPSGPSLSSSSMPSVNVQQHSTPRPSAPTDNEAADLMLFLATSPSPARPTPKPRDPSSYRSLGNESSSALRSKGRILFPSASAPDVMIFTHNPEDASSNGHHPRALPPPPASPVPTTLARTSDGTYALNTSASHLGSSSSSRNGGGGGELHGSRTLSASAITPAQLLPSAALPPPASPPPPSSVASRIPVSPLRKDVGGAHTPKMLFPAAGGGTPTDFNFNEFINASPSPSRPITGASQHKPNSSLRADVGRKLFEEEQMRHSHPHSVVGGGGAGGASQSPPPGKRHAERGLGAGIDIMQT